MEHRYDYGDEVRLIRNVRNDGTYPGLDVGTLLIKRGSVGVVINIGTFLQDQVIYTVNFLDQDRVVGCREEELIGADEHWVESRFDTREKVRARLALSAGGEVVVAPGAEGEVMRVLRDHPEGVHYHVNFADGRLFQVPEALLDAPENDHA